MNKFLVALSFVLPAIPFMALAQTPNSNFINEGNVKGIANEIINAVNGVFVPILFAAAFVVFIWGVFDYLILGASNEEKRKEGIKFVMYGLIGFFLMVSVWGIVNLLVSAFNFQNSGQVAPPVIQPIN